MNKYNDKIETIICNVNAQIITVMAGRVAIESLIREIVQKAIGEMETPESYLPKALTITDISLAQQAVEFHARNKVRSEILSNVEKLIGGEK